MTTMDRSAKLSIKAVYIAFFILLFISQSVSGKIKFDNIESFNIYCAADTDSVKRDVHADVISFDHRLYQKGVFLGTFDKKTSMIKGQVVTIIQIYDTEKTPVAEARASGVNPSSMTVTIFSSDEKVTVDVVFTLEAESIAKKLAEMGEL
jgi:hypothetical protein